MKKTILLLGTIKGLFIATSDGERRTWELAGPYFPGTQIYAVAFNNRNNRIWVSSNNPFYGNELIFSDDLGASWTKPEMPLVSFPSEGDESLLNIWQIKPSIHDSQTIFCGVQPACLFVSRDGGASFTPVEGFYSHPHRKEWMPGAGGLCLHTIIEDLDDPEILWTAVSTGGVYKTSDGGVNWAPKNKGIVAPFLPDTEPEFGQCVHKMVQHPTNPQTLFLQHHWGVYRSDDGGESWNNIGGELPSDFGFAMAISPVAPHPLYVIPLKSDEFRCCPDGKLAVYRLGAAGSWECLDDGLPDKNCYETILRDALSVDDAGGIYFGTRNGKLWSSVENGETWRLLFDALPAVLNVKAYQVI